MSHLTEKHPHDVGVASVDRILSIDVLRGLTILMMVFVNDLGPHAPSWLKHIQPSDADGMTVADIVFPFFLFLAGVSIPLAVERSRRQGDSSLRILGHVLTRTGGLLVMGLIGVNRNEFHWPGVAWLTYQHWALVASVAVLLAWCRVPRDRGRLRVTFIVLKCVGIAGLIGVLACYRRVPVDTVVLGVGEVKEWVWLRTQWWGILGLIGWAYLMGSLLYLIVGQRREWLVAGTAMLMSMFVVSQHDGFFARVEDKSWVTPLAPFLTWLESVLSTIDQYVSIGSQLGSLAAVVCCGVVLGVIMIPQSDVQSSRERVRWSAGYAVVLFLAGCFTDTFAGVNKIAATPTWCFWCSSLAVVCWIPLYILIDVKGSKAWSAPIRFTGENPLIAYMLHPIILYSITVAGVADSVRAYAASEVRLVVLTGSFTMAAAVCLLTIIIARLGLRIRI